MPKPVLQPRWLLSKEQSPHKLLQSDLPGTFFREYMLAYVSLGTKAGAATLCVACGNQRQIVNRRWPGWKQL